MLNNIDRLWSDTCCHGDDVVFREGFDYFSNLN